MKSALTMQRPRTLCDVADFSENLEAFGRHFRDWQHEIQRGGVHSKVELARRIDPPPRRLAGRMNQGDLADAMLAATAEWLADQAGISRPAWCTDSRRVAANPWFGSPLRGWLLAHAPASFRQRNLFTIPERVFTPKPGRPSKPEAEKAQKAAERQRAYRRRIRTLVEEARARTSPPSIH